MSATTKFRVFTVAAVSTLALIGSPAFAGTVLTEPATATGFVNGNGLTVTNQELYQGPGNPRPFAIKGLGSGNSAGGVWGAVNNTAGIGLYGTASSTNSFGVYGFNDGTGSAAISCWAARRRSRPTARSKRSIPAAQDHERPIMAMPAIS